MTEGFAKLGKPSTIRRYWKPGGESCHVRGVEPRDGGVVPTWLGCQMPDLIYQGVIVMAPRIYDSWDGNFRAVNVWNF